VRCPAAAVCYYEKKYKRWFSHTGIEVLKLVLFWFWFGLWSSQKGEGMGVSGTEDE
jgi:hypothetical protein